MHSQLSKISKFLSYILRHHPDSINLTLDSKGWAEIDELIKKSAQSKMLISREDISLVVERGTKKRFSISEDGRKIRATYGHSIPVNLELISQTPPELFFHGTASRLLQSILENGINSASRQFVHLSVHRATAIEVGQRHGTPVVLIVKALSMHKDGFQFYLSEDGTWLTSFVPKDYLDIE